MKLNLQSIYYKTKFWGKKNAPELLIAGSIVGMIGSIATAIYATTKLEKTLKPFNETLTSIHKDLKDDNKILNEVIDVNECKKELTKTYLKAGLKVTKLYLPSVLLLGTSISCVLGSHKVMKGRNIALAAAYTTLENGYNSYREKVKEKLGNEVEDQLYKNIKKEKVKEIDPKTGKEKTTTKEVSSINKDEFYDVIYSCGNSYWEKDATHNFDWLMTQQAYLNSKLIRRGYLFLYEVYDALGFTDDMLGPNKAQASRIMGWIYDPLDPNRDNYVSFGLTVPGTGVATPKVEEQLVNNVPNFWLSMNVDGDILSGKNGKKMFANYAKEGV